MSLPAPLERMYLLMRTEHKKYTTITELVNTECIDCLRNEQDEVQEKGGEITYHCSHLRLRFLEFRARKSQSKSCPARITDPCEMLHQLYQMKAYHISKNGCLSPDERMRNDLKKYKEIVKKSGGSALGWEDAYKSTIHRDDIKPGGGEKADKTNKIFGPERMKDNKPRYPWTELELRRANIRGAAKKPEYTEMGEGQ